MKKIIAINGSPRKNGNTATLLKKSLEGAASVGAETEMIHLIDLSYKGCISCYACKLKNTKYVGSCALEDDLTPVLKKAMEADAIVLGSPIYLADVTALMRAFIERFGFMNVSYSNKNHRHKMPKKNGAFVYTMNVKKSVSALFFSTYLINAGVLKGFDGHTTKLFSHDTYQFNDYTKYDATNFDEVKKRKVRDTIFPKDCKKAYKIGIELVTK